MKYIFLLLFLPLLSASDCNNKDKLPSCIQGLIDKGLSNSPPDAPIKVDEYTYNGQRVFLFTAPCCDHYNVLYDENCKEICAPSGGITGKGDGKCPEFDKNATFVKTAWTNPSK